jgi:hypothetical protein
MLCTTVITRSSEPWNATSKVCYDGMMEAPARGTESS